MIKKLIASVLSIFPGVGHFVMGNWMVGIALLVSSLVIINISEFIYLILIVLSVVDIWRRDFTNTTRINVGRIKISDI